MNANELNEPATRMMNLGSHALSDIENLSLIIAGDHCKKRALNVLNHISYNYSELSKMNYEQLKSLSLSHLQAIRIMAVFEFSRRKSLQLSMDVQKINCSKDIADVFQSILGELPHEEFWIAYMNRSNKIIRKEMLSKGGLSGTVTDVRIIMKRALELSASGIIVSHNHPSGNLQPSESDTKITRKIKEAGAIMDIQLLDHIIIAGKDYYSFADNGVL